MMKSWFKLTATKGNVKKRAHKKWLKKTGTWDWLRATEKIIHADYEKTNMMVKTNNMLLELARNGSAIVGNEKWKWECNANEAMPDIKALDLMRCGMLNA